MHGTSLFTHLLHQKLNLFFSWTRTSEFLKRQPFSLCLKGSFSRKMFGYAVDESVKDLSEKAHKTIIERLILAVSGTAHDNRTAIAGALYCVRYGILTKIWMPIGLPGEDGFLRAMILTENFTRDENLELIAFADGARHIFESERNIGGVFRHNIRLAIGTAINVLLFKHIRSSERIQKGCGGIYKAKKRGRSKLDK